MDGIGVGRQARGRLGFASGDDHLGFEAMQHVNAAGMVDSLAHLGENVIGHGVGVRAAARGVGRRHLADIEFAVAGGAPFLQGRHAHGLGRHPYPNVTSPHHMFPVEKPDILGIELVGDIVPFHQRGAVKAPGIGGTAHHHAGVIGQPGIFHRGGGVAGDGVGAGGAADEEFLLDIAMRRQVMVGGEENVIVGGRAGNIRGGDRPAHLRQRNLSKSGIGQNQRRTQDKSKASCHVPPLLLLCSRIQRPALTPCQAAANGAAQQLMGLCPLHPRRWSH